MVVLLLILSSFFFGLVFSHSIDAENDRVTDLPGFNHSDQIDHFAGFINIANRSEDSQRRDIFYWFVESQSSTRDEDPVILWTNGGPGCSGLLGLLSEHGPFRPAEEGATVDFFPYSWTSAASIIFVEQPLFVGYSLSSENEDFATDDDINAERLVSFIVQWFEKFDTYKGREFYLASESYGGHYMPVTSLRLLDYLADNPDVDISFRGFLVGNPYTNEVESNIGMMDAIWGHGLLPSGQYYNWKRQCGDGEESEDCSWLPWVLWDEYIGDTEIDIYALSYPLCEWGTDHMLQRFRLMDLKFQGKGVNASAQLGLPGLYEPCRESYLTAYLNREDVRSALHVDHKRTWTACDDYLFYNYSTSSMHTHMEQHYRTLVDYDYESLEMEPLKILVYSGDDDAVCGTEGTISWLFSLGFNVTAHWESWFFDDSLYGRRLGGFYSKLDGVHFATVHGAGHEVPAFKPEAALQLFRDFLSLPNTGPSKGRAYVGDEGDGKVCSHNKAQSQIGEMMLAGFIGVMIGMVLAASGGISYFLWMRDSNKKYEPARDMELPETSADRGSSAGGWDTKSPIHQSDIVTDEL